MTDWTVLDELYAFVKARATRKVAVHHIKESHLRMLADIYAEAKAKPYTLGIHVDYFRRIAMRDKDHADFKPEWTI